MITPIDTIEALLASRRVHENIVAIRARAATGADPGPHGDTLEAEFHKLAEALGYRVTRVARSEAPTALTAA